MEENKDMQEEVLDQEPILTEETGYRPRPKWQIVAAWIGLAVMVVGVALYYIHIATGG